MQSLSDMIQPEDNSYRPPHIKYQTPQGFDLMDIMTLAEHGQPYEYYHIARTRPGGWWQPPEETDVAGFGHRHAMKMSKNAILMPRRFLPTKAAFYWL